MFNSNYILMIKSGRKIFFSNIFSIFFIGQMDNWTHIRTKLLIDNHQLSNSNFNILLKCILYLFSLDIWKTGHLDKHNL